MGNILVSADLIAIVSNVMMEVVGHAKGTSHEALLASGVAQNLGSAKFIAGSFSACK
jgi:hypothetical protein